MFYLIDNANPEHMVFAVRTLEEVRTEYHVLAVGQSVPLGEETIDGLPRYELLRAS